MDFLTAAHTARGADLIRQWNERAAVVSAAVDGASPQAIDLPTILMQILPIIVALLTTGFTPAALLTVLPTIIGILFPNLDSGLVALLKQIIEFFVKP